MRAFSGLTAAFCLLAGCAQNSRTLAVEHEPDLAASGVNVSSYHALLDEAQTSRTDVLIVQHEGTVLDEQYFENQPGKLYPVHSITKSVIALALGSLIEEGKIPSLDEPMSRWFPAWKKDGRAKITLRHILTQSSGLAHHQGDTPLHRAYDSLEFVRDIPLVDTPGEKFVYNTEAVQSLSRVIRAASGDDAETYVSEKIFKPLGITRWTWDRDLAGNALTYTGLSLDPRDLAKIGQLVLQDGQWNGRPVISKTWIHILLTPSTVTRHYGLLWWIFYENGQPTCYFAEGWLGQYLVVCPDTKAIGVRVHRGPPKPDSAESDKYGFKNFHRAFRSLFKEKYQP